LHSPLQRATHSLKGENSSASSLNRERLIADNPIPMRLGQRGGLAKNDDFSFKSATKFGPQMVYELNEKSNDLTEKTPFQLNRRLRGKLVGAQSTF